LILLIFNEKVRLFFSEVERTTSNLFESRNQLTNVRDRNKESWPKGPGFGLPLKGAVLLKTVEVKSVYLWLAG